MELSKIFIYKKSMIPGHNYKVQCFVYLFICNKQKINQLPVVLTYDKLSVTVGMNTK